VDLRIRDPAPPLEEVEVADFVGLADVLREEAVVATRIIAWRRRPNPEALGDLLRCRWIERFETSTVIRSPLRTAANGPSMWTSGEPWRMQAP
jgi:hypothetical protein